MKKHHFQTTQFIIGSIHGLLTYVEYLPQCFSFVNLNLDRYTKPTAGLSEGCFSYKHLEVLHLQDLKKEQISAILWQSTMLENNQLHKLKTYFSQG